MGDSPDAPACPQPCGEPSHFLRHLREAIARVRAFPGEPDPRAQVTISPDLRDRIADVDAARERAYADGPIAAATAQLSQLAGWRVAVDPACPDGVVLIVPPRASDDPGSPQLTLRGVLPDHPDAPACRHCGCVAVRHAHLHDRTYCGTCGPKRCSHYRPTRRWSRSPIGNAVAILASWALPDRRRPH